MERRERQTGTGENSLPPAFPGNPAGPPGQTGLLPEAARSPLVFGRPLSGGRGPSPKRAGLRWSPRGLHPPAAAVADGGVRLAELPVLSAARPVCGFAEPRRRVLRDAGGHSAAAGLWAGAGPGAASSFAASSQCSVSREPRLVDAEPFGSAAASSSRCKRTSAWRPEPCQPPADTPRTEPPFSALPAAPHLPSPRPRPSCSLPFLCSLGKWFLLPGEVSGGRPPPAAAAMGQITCGGGRAEYRGQGVAAGS